MNRCKNVLEKNKKNFKKRKNVAKNKKTLKTLDKKNVSPNLFKLLP